MKKIKAQIEIFEIDSTEVEDKFLEIESHWNSSILINLIIDGKKYSVSAQTLRSAIERTQDFT